MDNKQVYLIEIDADATAFAEKLHAATIDIDKLAEAADQAKNSFSGAGDVIGNMSAATATIGGAEDFSGLTAEISGISGEFENATLAIGELAESAGNGNFGEFVGTMGSLAVAAESLGGKLTRLAAAAAVIPAKILAISTAVYTFATTSLPVFAASAWLAVAPFAPFIAAFAAISAAIYVVDTAINSLSRELEDIGTVVNATSDDLENLGSKAKDFAINLGTSISQTTAELKKLAETNPELLMTQEAMGEVLAGAISLSKAVGGDLPNAVDVTSAALAKFNLSTNDTAQIVDTIAYSLADSSFKDADVSMSDYSDSLNVAGDSARKAFVNFKEFDSVLRVLANEDLKGDKLNESLNAIYTTIGELNTEELSLTGMLDKFGEANLKANDYVKIFGAANAHVAQLMVESREEISESALEVAKLGTAYVDSTAYSLTFSGQLAELGSALSEAAQSWGSSLKTWWDSSVFVTWIDSAKNWIKSVKDEMSMFFGWIVSGLTKVVNAFSSLYGGGKKEITKGFDVSKSGLRTGEAVTLGAAVKEDIKQYANVDTGINLDALNSKHEFIVANMKKTHELAMLTKEDYEAQQLVVQALASTKKTATTEEKEALIEVAKEYKTAEEHFKDIQKITENLTKGAETAGIASGFAKDLWTLQKFGATQQEIADARSKQQKIELGENSLSLEKTEKELAVLQATVGVTGIHAEQLKAIAALKTDNVDKSSAEYQAQAAKAAAQTAQKINLEAKIKTVESVQNLEKEAAAARQGALAFAEYNAKKSLGLGATDQDARRVVQGTLNVSILSKTAELKEEIAAYQQGAVAVAQYNAAKSIGAGANPDQANILINQNLALSIAQKTQAAKQAYDMSLLSESAQKLETERLSLGTTATKEHAAALVELGRVTKANNEIAAAQRDVSAAGLTQPAREYLKIMQDIGEVQGVQLINLKNIAAAQTAGVNAKASLEKELMLAQMSTKDAEKFKTLENVAPAQRAEINALLEQKNQIDKVKQSWDNAATSFVDYAQQVVTKKTSLKDAFNGFMIKINEDQIKAAFEQVKTALTKQPVSLEGALNFSDAKARQDVTAASAVFKTYETSLMTGTDGSVNKLITGIDTSISKLTQAIDSSLGKLAANIPKATAANEAVYRQAANDSVVKSLNIDSNLTSREGLRVKGGIDGQAFAGGKNAAGLTALAQLIQKAEGDLLNRFSAFNDKYHQGTGSMHAKGLALDFSVKNASKSAEAAKIVTDLGKQLGVALKVIDEYKNPSARSTGGHIHVNFKSQADADKLLQNVTGKVGQAIDIHTQALDTHKNKIVESAQTHEAHGHVINAHAERVNVDSNALAKHADKTLIDTSKADVMPWGTPAKSGAELSSAFNGVKIDTSQGEKTPWGASYQNSNEIAGGYSGFLGGVGAAGSQLLSGNLSGAADIGKGLMGSYGSEIMGGVNIAKSLFSGDKAGALGGAISLGVTAALTPVLGPFASIAGGLAGQLGGKVFGSWTVESKNLTASIQGLSGTFKEKTIEVNKGMVGGGKRTTYTDVSDEQNKQLQAALKSVTSQMETIGKQLGQSIVDSFKADNFRWVVDMVHAQTGTFEQQFARAQAAMIKDAVTGKSIAGVDTSLTDVMANKVSSLLKSAGDGVYDKALQGFMWRPDTQKYAKEINGPIKDGLNSLISSTDWQGLDVAQTTAKLQTYLTDSFSKAGVDVPVDTFKNMASDLTGQIQNGLKFLETSKNTVNPDAPFFKNMREIVQNFDAWNAKPEEVTAFIGSIINLKDAFKAAQLSTSGITQALIDVAGGNEKIAALTQNISAYSAAFFDEGTKNSTKIASLTYDVSTAFASYGAQVPKTKADFVALTNSLDLTTESGQKAFVALMEVAPKFSELATLQASAGVGLDMFTAKLAELPNNLSSIASAMSNSLNSSVQNKVGAAQAGKDLGKAMANEVQNSLKNAYTSTILNMVMQGLVQPMIAAGVQNANMTMQSGAITSQNLSLGGANAANNMSMGGANAASGMTSGANNAASGMTIGGSTAAAALAAGGETAANYIAGVTNQILSTMQIMGEIMKDSRITDLMAKITPAVETVGSQAYTAMTDSSSFIGQDFSINSSSTGAAGASGGGTDNSAQQALDDAKKIAESLKKIANNLDDFASGLEGNALKMYQLNKKYGKTDLSALGLTGQSMPDAQKFIGMSDTAKQSLATQAGVTLDDLSTDIMDYLGMLRTEEKARKDFNEGLLKYTTAGENSTRLAKQIQSDAINMGASQEQIIAYIQGADLEGEAKKLGTTVDVLKSTIIPSVLQGLLDYGKGLTDLQNNTLSVYSTGKKTDNNSVWIETLTLETAKLGMSAKDAAVWVEAHKNELNTYAQAMNVPVDDLIKTIIPQTLQGLKSLGDGLKSLQYDMLGLVDKSFTPAQRTITELAAKYPMLDLAAKSHSMTSQQLANFYLHATDDQVAAFAKLANVSPEELLKDAGALAKAMQDNEGAAKSLADSWIENFKRVTDSIDTLSGSIKTDIGTVEGKKGLSDSIAAAKTSNDAVYTAKISDINTTYEAAPQTDKTAALLTKVNATEQAYTDSVASFNSKRAAIVADFTAQFSIQNQALKDKVFASYTGSKANILQDPEELSKRVAAANELRQALTSQYAEQAKVIQDKYKIESDNAAKLLEAAKNIANTIRDLRLDSSLSTLTKKQQLGESKAAFDELVAKAVNNNDATAAAEAQNMAKTVLGKGRDYNASSAAYTALFKDVEGGLGKIKTKFGDAATVAKTKSFEETPYAAELKTLQMNTVSQLKEIDAAGQWVKEHGTEELATGLINLGAQFGLDIGQVVDTLKLNFPALGEKMQGVINAIGKISSPTVSDSQINEYVQGAVTRAGGVNANSVKDIADTAKQYNIAPERMASALGTDTATVSQTAAKYGQDYTSVTDSQIKSFVADATAQYGTGTKEGVTAIYNAAKQHGVTSSRLAGAIGWSNEDVLNMARQYDLPAFAEGGIVNKPTIGLFGERGPEAIMPLHKLPDIQQSTNRPEQTAALLEAIRQMIAAQRDTQSTLQKINETLKAAGTEILTEVKNLAKKTALLIGEKINSLLGK